MNTTHHNSDIITYFGIQVGKKVKENLTFSVCGRLGGKYHAFTPENLEAIEKYAIERVQFCHNFMSMWDRFQSIVNEKRFVQLVAGKQLKDGTFTGLSNFIYSKSSINILSTGSYYHFSPEEQREASFLKLIEEALLQEKKEN